MKNPELFIKLMMMTTSDRDGEALVAVRKANAMLGEINLNWEEFITGLVQSSAPVQQGFRPVRPERNPRAAGMNEHDIMRDAHVVEPMFDLLFDTLPSAGGFVDFVNSVHDYWVDHGYLTKRQFEVIERAYNNNKNGKRRRRPA